MTDATFMSMRVLLVNGVDSMPSAQILRINVIGSLLVGFTSSLENESDETWK